MPDGTFVNDRGEVRITPSAAVAVGELWQLPDGRAGIYPGGNDGRTAANSGARTRFEEGDVYSFPITSGITILAGGRCYWDYSANAVHYKKVNDRDFYMGRAVDDSSGGTVSIALGIDPPYDIDLMRDGFLSVPVGTQALGGFGYPLRLGGALQFALSATNEAQKVDALSVDGFSKDANAIIELVFRVPSDGAGTVVDASLGIANATHATDADSITESIFVHLDANNTNINLESDDGTTEVAATDSTYDYTEGSAVANRVEVWIDMRTPADCQIYVNGVLALTASVFNVNAATGPFFLLIHLEKTASTDAYTLVVDRATARYSEQ